jgi:hypothetical protein
MKRLNFINLEMDGIGILEFLDITEANPNENESTHCIIRKINIK